MNGCRCPEVFDRFDSVLGSRRGGGLRATVPERGPSEWRQYLIYDRRDRSLFRAPIYLTRERAAAGAAALGRRRPDCETEIRPPLFIVDAWRVFYRLRERA